MSSKLNLSGVELDSSDAGARTFVNPGSLPGGLPPNLTPASMDRSSGSGLITTPQPSMTTSAMIMDTVIASTSTLASSIDQIKQPSGPITTPQPSMMTSASLDYSQQPTGSNLLQGLPRDIGFGLPGVTLHQR